VRGAVIVSATIAFWFIRRRRGGGLNAVSVDRRRVCLGIIRGRLIGILIQLLMGGFYPKRKERKRIKRLMGWGKVGRNWKLLLRWRLVERGKFSG
jgi:hypothetical protein